MTLNPMIFGRQLLIACLVAVCALVGMSVRAETLETALMKHYPAGSITSVQIATAALKDIDPARREAEQRFAEDRARCYDQFFTSSCLSDAKELRRISLSNIRKIEVEANALLRKEKAAERDRTIAEKQVRAVTPPGKPAIPISGATREGTSGEQPEKQSEKQSEKP